MIDGTGRDATPAAGEEQRVRVVRAADLGPVLAPGGDERPGAGGQRNLAELIAFAEDAGLAGAGRDGDVGVVEGGELGFAQPGVEGERHEGVVAHAAALGGAQQPSLLVLVQGPVAVRRLRMATRATSGAPRPSQA